LLASGGPCDRHRRELAPQVRRQRNSERAWRGDAEQLCERFSEYPMVGQLVEPRASAHVRMPGCLWRGMNQREVAGHRELRAL